MGNFGLPSIIAKTGTSVAAVSTDPVEGTSGIADRLSAEREIRRRLLDYCRGIDTCDVGLVASVYHPDSFDDHGSFQGSGHDFARYATAALRERYEATQHTIGDSAFDWMDHGTVATATYVQAQHLGRDDDGHYLEWFAGVYVDLFELRDGSWRIAKRRLLHTWDKIERIDLCFEPGRFTDRTRV